MIAPAFDYCKPQSLAEALSVLHSQGDAAQVLAGGQSLLAMMNLRLGAASLLVDITGLEELKTVTEHADHLRIGALVTHSQLLANPLVARHLPLLHLAVPHVAHLAIRNRGTLGGSLALADPAAEYPAVALAAGAVLVLQGQQGERRVKAADFFQGLYATARQANELLVAVEWPKIKASERVGFDELSRRRGDYAMVGLACALRVQGSQVQEARLAYLAVGDGPVLARRAMAALQGKALDAATIPLAQQALAQDLSPNGDLQADPATKIHLARVLLGRALNALRSAS